MVGLNGYTTTSHHRQNRRRERPGSRTRRTITRKSNVQFDCVDGMLDARDSSVPLPSDKTRPSPLLRQNFDQSWQRWKAREAEERALAETNKMLEQQRVFGGEVDDDELYRMGILYDNNEEDVVYDFESKTTVCDVPVEVDHSIPMFSIRYGKPRRSRRSTWRSLPLYLSFSDLSHDADVARLLSPSLSHTPTIQHRTTQNKPDIDIPQSLPPVPAFSDLHFIDSTNTQTAIPIPTSIPILQHEVDWTFITAPHNTPSLTPNSEPETWILIDDL